MRIFFDALAVRPAISIGTQAYIISGLQILEKKFPHSEYVMISSQPAVDGYFLKNLPYHVTLVQREKGVFKTMSQFRKIVSTVDAVVSSWGDAYISIPPNKLFRKMLLLKKKGVPLVLFTSSMGPFTGGFKNFLTKRGMRMFDYISVRDQITYDGLIKLGVKNISLVHDTAFVLTPADDDRINFILDKAGLRKDTAYLGFGISVLMHHLFRQNGKNYAHDMARMIDWLRDTYKLPIVLIPHQLYPPTYRYAREQYESACGDDRYAIELVWEKLSNTTGVYRMNDDFSPMELKGIIRRSEIFIGGRMHSVIAAISQCIPSLIMQYSHKAGGMMQVLNMPEYVWDIKESIETLQAKVADLWLNREKVKTKLRSEMPKNIADIYALADEVKKLMP